MRNRPLLLDLGSDLWDSIGVKGNTPMHIFTNASKIGTLIPRTGLSYCEDDNTYTEYTFEVNAWACSLDDRPFWTYPKKESQVDLFTEMFGES